MMQKVYAVIYRDVRYVDNVKYMCGGVFDSKEEAEAVARVGDEIVEAPYFEKRPLIYTTPKDVTILPMKTEDKSDGIQM